MSLTLVALAGLMALATYPWRAVPLLAPGIERLPAPVRTYLRLVGPAILAALAIANVAVGVDADGGRSLRLGVELVAVVGAAAMVLWRRNLLLGLLLAVVLVAAWRAAGG